MTGRIILSRLMHALGGATLRLAREIRETLKAPAFQAQLAARRSAARPR
jgi:hypothetical protein